MTCKGTLRPVFNRVYRLEIQSFMLVFRQSFCPSNFLSGSLPLPCVKVQDIQTVCEW
jgi:hypothetical protein